MKISTFPHQLVLSARVAPLVLATGGIGLLAGCGTPNSHVVSAPPPDPPAQVVTVQPGQAVTTATPTQSGTVIVAQAPPTSGYQPQVVVARPQQPSADHVWIEGYWTWQNNRYEWVPGHWTRPPSRGITWVPPTWERRSDGNYVFTEGYWR